MSMQHSLLRAFSLLESLIYIAVFSLIITGSFTGISTLTESANRNETRALLQSEGDFLLGKISYELSQGVPISAFSLTGATVTLSGLALSSGNVQVSDFSVVALPSPTQTSFTLSALTTSGQMLSDHFSGISYSSP